MRGGAAPPTRSSSPPSSANPTPNRSANPNPAPAPNLNPNLNPARTPTQVEFTAKQCRAARDSIVKTIYNHIFDYVVEKVNAHIGGAAGSTDLPCAGLLDP